MSKNDLIQVQQDLSPNNNLFHQAIADVLESVKNIYDNEPEYKKQKICTRLTHHDRIVKFRVTWEDDKGEIHHNNGWRVQHNNALGAYKGGLRFHPNVSEQVFQFLSFEQTFKNALTGLPMGGAKGGADFNPKGKSDREILRFCQAFMRQIAPYIGEKTDVPAGDIGVGTREIGYMFGTYKAMTNTHGGVLTGKGLLYGGSLLRTEATGYGAAYFLQNVLKQDGLQIKDMKIAISGAGNVAIHLAEKIISLGGCVVTISDSNGALVNEGGFSNEDIKSIKTLKLEKRDRLENFSQYNIKGNYHKDALPWGLCDYDIAAPSATQNEVDKKDITNLQQAGARYVLEAANMPLTSDASKAAIQSDITILPSKAVNAGGVAVSGIERSQNAIMENWDIDHIDEKLKSIMAYIYQACIKHAPDHKSHDRYIHGANIAGFRKVADAIIAQGALN